MRRLRIIDPLLRLPDFGLDVAVQGEEVQIAIEIDIE